MSGVTLGDKRLAAHIKTIADAIASADIRQTDREAVARTVGIALANGDPAIAAHVNAGVFARWPPTRSCPVPAATRSAAPTSA